MGAFQQFTFYDWTRNHGLAAAKLPDGRWVTSKVLIDVWVLGLWQQQQTSDQGNVAAKQTLNELEANAPKEQVR